MTEPSTAGRRGRRGVGVTHAEPRAHQATRAHCPLYYTPNCAVDILSDEASEIIENNAETILEEIGIDFRDDPEALQFYGRWV